MQPVVNQEENFGKIVGKRRAPVNSLQETPAQTIADSRAWQKTFHPLPIPRGVYRFKTHEEADEWLWQMLTRRRK
jgi:hypothetical protein